MLVAIDASNFRPGVRAAAAALVAVARAVLAVASARRLIYLFGHDKAKYVPSECAMDDKIRTICGDQIRYAQYLASQRRGLSVVRPAHWHTEHACMHRISIAEDTIAMPMENDAGLFCAGQKEGIISGSKLLPLYPSYYVP